MIPYTLENWNEDIIQRINDLAASPDSGCSSPGPLTKLTAPARWSKQNITDAQEKLLDICPDNTFETIPDKWEQSIIDELETAIDLGWCDCDEGPLATYTNQFINAWGFVEGMTNPTMHDGFFMSSYCGLFSPPISYIGCYLKRYDAGPYTLIDDSENRPNVDEIERTYNEIEVLIPEWEDARSRAKYWDYQASIAETPAEVAEAETKRDSFQAIADTKSIEIDTLALANAVYCRALTGITNNTPNLARTLYDNRSITKAFAYGNAYAIIYNSWDTGIYPSTHTQSTFEVDVKHSDEEERYLRFEGKCTPNGLIYILTVRVSWEFEKLILFAAADSLWYSTSYRKVRRTTGSGLCEGGGYDCWETSEVTPPTEEDIVTSDVYLKTIAGIIDA